MLVSNMVVSTSDKMDMKYKVIFTWLILPFAHSLEGVSPEISEHPVDQAVNRGEPATLNCGARGEPQPFISWFKDGKPVLLDEKSDHVVMLPTGGLFFLRTVENSRSKDSGMYHCKAENKFGSVESKPAKLTVTYLRTKFGEVPRSLQVEEGQPLRLYCKPPEGNPPPKIYWEKDGSTLVNDDFFSIDKTTGDLLIPEAGVEDTGSYVCLASSADMTRRDLTVKVKVTRRAVEIRQEIIPAIPTITDAYMVDPVTGIVHWTAVDHVTGYTILLTANSADVTNITVEADVNQIKLHSLDPGLAYSVQVAALYGGEAGLTPPTPGEFSAARKLMYKTHEVVLVNNGVDGEIPVKVWAIAMAIVIIVTLTIVMAAALLCYKTKKFGGGGSNGSRHSTSCSEYGVRNITWDRRPGTTGNGVWDDNSPTTSFRSQNRLLQECGGGPMPVVSGVGGGLMAAQGGGGGNGYEYAVPSHHHHLLHPVHYSSGGSGGGGSNHYASNTILKPAYYEPLNLHQVTSSDSSFESEYKTPLDIKSSR